MPDPDHYSLSTVAHVKLLMHALKYHYASVNGFLLVEDGNSKNKTKGKEENNRIDFVDAIPLFHLGHGLTPMIEVALLQVRGRCVCVREYAFTPAAQKQRMGPEMLTGAKKSHWCCWQAESISFTHSFSPSESE